MQFIIPDNYQELVDSAGMYNQYTLPDTTEILKQMGFQHLSLHAQSPIFYVVDYVNQKYLYIDPTVKVVLGYEASAIREAGPMYFTSLWHPDDFKIFSEDILPESLQFLRSRKSKEYPDFSFSFNYRIKTNNGEYRTLLQRSTYFLAAENGHPLAAVGFGLDITHFKDDNNIVHTIEKIDRRFNMVSNECLYKKIYYPDKEKALLTNRELEVLRYIHKGLGSKAIAGELYVSVNTVHNHRKSMLQKTGCKNSSELLYHANKNGWL